jgi:hypothetical protein
VLTPPVASQIADALVHLGYGREVYLLSGNHDLDANEKSILTVFDRMDGGVTVLEPWGLEHIIEIPHEKFIYIGIPYCPVSEVKEIFSHFNTYSRPVIAFMHHHFDGAVHGAHEYQPAGGIAPAMIPDNTERILTGHYHKHHYVGDKVTYVGAPLQHDFGEADYEPCYHLLDPETAAMLKYSIPASVAPRFHIVAADSEDELPGDPRSDYYRIDWPMDTDSAMAKDKAAMLTNVIIRPVPVAVSVRSRISEHLEKKGKTKGGAIPINDVVEAYAALNSTEERFEDMRRLGLNIMRSVLDDLD